MSTHQILEPRGTLVEAEERSRQYAGTFQIPALEIRMAGQIGFLAKIGLEDEEDGERFWVQIVEVREDESYVGRIDNDLYEKWGVDFDDLIVFYPRHILDMS
jgi:hypothetical protein